MSDTDHAKFATETMLEMTKQLLTISSGFLVISVALLKVLWPQDSGLISYFELVAISWLCIIVSILSGLFVFGGVATSAHDNNKFDVDDFWTKWPLRVQQISFFAAFGFFAVFSYCNIPSESETNPVSKHNDINIVIIAPESEGMLQDLLDSSLNLRDEKIMAELQNNHVQTNDHLDRHLNIVISRLKKLLSKESDERTAGSGL